MGKYFNINEDFGTHSSRTIRVRSFGEGNGFQIMKGGMIKKDKLIQADVIAWCETSEEAARLIKALIEI